MKSKYRKSFFTFSLSFVLLIGGIVLLRVPIENISKADTRLRSFVKQANQDYEDPFENYFNEGQFNLDIQHYNISVELDHINEILAGKVILKGKFTGTPARMICLNLHDNMKISKVKLNTEEVNYSHDNTTLEIENEKLFTEYFIEIVYEGQPKSLGFGSFEFGNYESKPVIYTLSEPNHASTWFPCNDLPDDKATLEMNIKADSNLTSISNGVLDSVTTYNDKRIFHWSTKYPISTYLVCINTGYYKEFTQKYITDEHEMDLEFYVFENHYEKARKDFDDHVLYLDFFGKTFGEYPFINDKYGIVEFLWGRGAMEHQTITGFSYNFITGQKRFERIMLHELAHQWWGNAVGLKSWKDIWLNEGFATYSEALYYENRDGPKALQRYMKNFFGYYEHSTLYNPEGNLFSATVYRKGAWVLHMLRKEVGDNIFFEILRNYYDTYKYKNASTYDFKETAEKISGRNLNKFFDQWVFDGTGIVDLKYKLNYAEDNNIYNASLLLKQVQYRYKEFHFPLDVKINDEIYNFYINTSDTVVEIKLNEKPADVKLDPDVWLLSNITRLEETE
ncbi:MAG: M1 family metallopeptidase [Ignavibacteria bacterium]|jgi:aminopeptidase N